MNARSQITELLPVRVVKNGAIYEGTLENGNEKKKETYGERNDRFRIDMASDEYYYYTAGGNWRAPIVRNTFGRTGWSVGTRVGVCGGAVYPVRT